MRQRLRSKTFFCRSEKNDSMAALSRRRPLGPSSREGGGFEYSAKPETAIATRDRTDHYGPVMLAASDGRAQSRDHYDRTQTSVHREVTPS